LLRKLAGLEQQGAEALFGEPALQLEDILHPDRDGRGRIHLLDASRLVHEAPKVYATFLLWLLAELFEQLPERGDAEKPLLALFFDEAHLLFADTPKALQERLEQVVSDPSVLSNAEVWALDTIRAHLSARYDVAALLGLTREQAYDDAAIYAAVELLRRYLAAAANRETVRAVAENNPPRA
jgi:DNA helicase HerA-like ATPase